MLSLVHLLQAPLPGVGRHLLLPFLRTQVVVTHQLYAVEGVSAAFLPGTMKTTA